MGQWGGELSGAWTDGRCNDWQWRGTYVGVLPSSLTALLTWPTARPPPPSLAAQEWAVRTFRKERPPGDPTKLADFTRADMLLKEVGGDRDHVCFIRLYPTAI